MIRKILKWTGIILITVFVVVLLFWGYFNLPVKNERQDVSLGTTFSYTYAEDLGLDWKETFIAILDDLEIKKIRIPVYWDRVETEEGVFDFSLVDWQIEEASKRDAEIVLAIGQKVPRWPECHIPKWIGDNDLKRKGALVNFLGVIVDRYKNKDVIKYWQVENEPFLNFGICPPVDANLIDREISQVRSKDQNRKIIMTDSGELSLWLGAAKRADVFGTTMYLDIWSQKFGYYEYPIGPRFFWFKKWLINIFAKQDQAIVIELQAEPWMAGWVLDFPVEDQLKHMNPKLLSENVSFAKKVGFSEVYLWGTEWWYYMKVKQDHPEIWEEARILFN